MTVILNSPDSPLNNPLPPKQPPLWWIVLFKTIHYLTELRSRHVIFVRVPFWVGACFAENFRPCLFCHLVHDGMNDKEN